MIRRHFFTCLCALLGLTAAFEVRAEIQQSYCLSDVLNVVDEHTLVFFDLDNTLIETAQSLGSDQWFNHTLEKHLKAGESFEEALDAILPVWWRIAEASRFQAVEDDSAEVVSLVQDRAFAVLGLTSRSASMIPHTERQLNGVGIDFRSTARCLPDRVDGVEACELGIIFCGGKNKGQTLERIFPYIDGLGYTRIVFVDDTIRHLRSVEAVVEEHGYEFVGLRYGGADEKVHNFDAELTEIQLCIFEYLASDEMARALVEDRIEDVVQHLRDYLREMKALP